VSIPAIVTDGSTPTGLVLPGRTELAALLGQVWDSFIGEDVTMIESAVHAPKGQIAADERAVASVSITGPWNGHLMISMSEDAASLVAGLLFELEPADVGVSELADAIGELANVVGGNVKAMLPEPSTLSLPQVVVDAHAVTLYSACLKASSTIAWREHHIDVTLWESVSRRPIAA
jgi:chemotaxis protein CheX